MNIRVAKIEDTDDLQRMGAAFFVEAGHAELTGTLDPVSFGRTLAILASVGLLLVAEKGGKVVGMAAADVAPAFWNDKVLLGREVFWYVDPEHRKGLGRKLLVALEAASRNYGASFFDVVAEPGVRSKALSRLYEMGGFNPAETVFRKRLGL